MDQDVPAVLRAFPSIAAVLFVWSSSAYHWFCTQGMACGPWIAKGARKPPLGLDEFPQRSSDNAWAVFCPVVAGKKVASGPPSVARRLLGQGADRPWILINMTTYGNQSLAEWGGGPLDFFTMVHLATSEKGADLVSLNTPPSVIQQIYGAYQQPAPTIYWLTKEAECPALPEFSRSYFSCRADEQEWWERVRTHTAVDLHVLPPSFDPDTQAPPTTFWKK